MAKLKILIAGNDHFKKMIEIDHSLHSHYAYRLQTNIEDHTSTFTFTRVKLPREAHLSYMRDMDSLITSWDEASQVFVGELDDVLISYVVLDDKTVPVTTRVSDLVVIPELRQKGIGRTMLAMVENWAAENQKERVLLETPMRNYPMVELALNCGYEICGFLDHYFPNGDPALFYQKRLA